MTTRTFGSLCMPVLATAFCLSCFKQPHIDPGRLTCQTDENCPEGFVCTSLHQCVSAAAGIDAAGSDPDGAGIDIDSSIDIDSPQASPVVDGGTTPDTPSLPLDGPGPVDIAVVHNGTDVQGVSGVSTTAPGKATAAKMIVAARNADGSLPDIDSL